MSSSSTGRPMYTWPDGTTSNVPYSLDMDIDFNDVQPYVPQPDETDPLQFLDDEEDLTVVSPQQAGAVVLGQIPGRTNTPYGHVTIRQEQTGPLEASNVPIRNFSAVIYVTDPMADINMVQRACLRELIRSHNALFAASSFTNDVYGQVRLLRMEEAGMTSDLVTAMSPLDRISDEFELTAELFEQSDHELDPMARDSIEFKYTFIFPQGVPITPTMVRNTTTAFRSSSSNSTQTRINYINTQARFLAMQNIVSASGGARRSIDSSLTARRDALEQAALDRYEMKKDAKNIAKGLRKKNSQKASKQKRKAPAVKSTSASKRTLTQKQKDNSNSRRRKKYHEDKDTRGQSYQLLKRKIFHHTSLDQFYEHSKAVLMVPNTEQEGLCMAMAIIRSELRTYDIESGAIVESKAEPIGDAEAYRTFPISERVQNLLSNSDSYSFLTGGEEEEPLEGVLFNPYKPMRRLELGELEEGKSPLKYALVLEDAEVQSWYNTAQAFIEYIQQSVKNSMGLAYEEIDPNKEENFLQAVCNVLDVYIGIYVSASQAKRVKVYKPDYRAGDVRKNDPKIEMINLLVAENHCSAITNLREFVKNRANASRTSINNYCVLCERVTTSNNNSIAECKVHFKKCLADKDGQLDTVNEVHHRKKYIKTYTPKAFVFNSKFKAFECRTCRALLERGQNQMDHVCYIVRPEELDEVAKEDVYVYDFEAAQVEDENLPGVLVHDVNLACVRAAYPDSIVGENRQQFYNIDDFMVWVLSQTGKRRVYIAHNAGSYDVQFIMRYLERNLIPHSFIPAPSSIHKYLSVTIPFGAGFNATFLDFRNYMPASLKNIGISFGLNLAKGDFPHHFNNGWRDLFEGRIPILDDPRDFWCMKTKRTQEEVSEFHEWYNMQCTIYCTCDSEVCSCGKEPWKFREQLARYCWLDVDVLAEAVVKYRNNAMSFASISSKEDNCGWEPKNIDPYAHLTIAQMAMKLLLAGLPEPEMITITPNKVRVERSQVGIAWMEREARASAKHIFHIGNSNKEYFCLGTNRYLDGYCAQDNSVYVCFSCEFHGCPTCFYQEIQTGKDHPCRPGTYGAVNHDTKQFAEDLIKTYGLHQVHIIWACQMENVTAYEWELGDIMKERDCFYGGRTEAFSPYTHASSSSGRQIKYKDVCSLYPYICARKKLPTGNPIHLCGIHIDRSRLHPDSVDPYFGFVKCEIFPNKEDLLGLLPKREVTTGRLEFPLVSWTGSFGTEELSLAVRNGYTIGEVYEVFHWGEEESSDLVLRGYVSFFLRMKQEAEGWVKLGGTSEDPSEEEKDFLIEQVFLENGSMARIRKGEMQKNPTKRQVAKIFLNSLWGKFCQKPNKTYFVTIHGYAQFAKLWHDPTIDRKSFSFRHLEGNTWKARYDTIEAFTKPNPKYNLFLAAKVTEWGRTILHEEMLRIGPQNVLYCDTDSIMYECDDTEVLPGHGLGEWVDEYPRDRIMKLYVLAPKFYFLLKESGECLLKSKGVQMTLRNSKMINENALIPMLLEVLYPKLLSSGEKEESQTMIEVDNMIMGINSTNASIGYGTMLTRYTAPKKVRPVYSKRLVVTMPPELEPLRPTSLVSSPRIYTIPKGFESSVEDIARLVYESLY